MNMGTILIVDDNPDIRTVIAACLQDFSYATREASNGLEALDLLQETDQIDLILLDLSMPVMDGATFIHWLEKRGSRAQYPIVLMSAQPELAREAARLQVGYLAKPLELDDLLSLVVAQQHRKPTRVA